MCVGEACHSLKKLSSSGTAMFASTTGKIPAGKDSQLAMPMRERDLEALTEIFDDLDTEQAENIDEAIATLSTPNSPATLGGNRVGVVRATPGL
jgi:hypothetical protein